MMKFPIAQLMFNVVFELLSTSSTLAISLKNETSGGLNVVVIGAGASGLVSAKYAIEQGYKVTVYEQAEELGGQWVYTDKVGKDQYGNDIHSSMYKDLRTNAPIQGMQYKDHYYPDDTPTSYPRSEVVLTYLRSYADRFDLRKHIKFSHLVVRVRPVENGKWEVIVKDQPNNRFETKIYDVVFVCNGHYSFPHWPEIEGANRFNGEMMHSHNFRTVDNFRGEKVLIIGGGPSGIDLASFVSKVANEVTLSITKPKKPEDEQYIRRQLPESVALKYNVMSFTTNGASFIDGTYQNFTKVIYATGYRHSYRFLSVDSGIHVDDNFVEPLYKHIFNIKNPTMAFIGASRTVINFITYDLQARFAMKFISGAKKLPSKIDMLNDMWTESKDFWTAPYLIRLAKMAEYYMTLSKTADIENIPEVILNIENDASNERQTNPPEYRNFKYTILDDKKFKKEKVKYQGVEIA